MTQNHKKKATWPWRLRPLVSGALASLLATSLAVGQSTAPPSPPPTTDERTSDLVKRLLKGESKDETDLMTHIVTLMEESRERLHRTFDPGPQTQAVQREIIKNIDDAIATALRQQSNAAAQSATADERRMPDPDDPSKKDDEQPSGEDAAGRESGQTDADADATREKTTGPFKETQRGWGHLPAREREEIIQGIGEDVLEGYRELVERYYRALAEEKEPQK